VLLLLLSVLAGCGAPPSYAPPSDDPDHYPIDTAVEYDVELSDPRWVAPAALPPGVDPLASNNNVDLAFHGGRLFLAFRNAESHFASPRARMIVISTTDLEGGGGWELEHVFALEADVREPRLLSHRGRLALYFFEAGTNPLAFEPKQIWRSERGEGGWGGLAPVLIPGEVPWTMKVRGGRVYLTSYLGPHYASGPGELDLRFQVSDDGIAFAPVDPARPAVYHGGVSEAAFELDEAGALWAVTRNEDGDATGFGSHLCTAPAGALAAWQCPSRASPERYDSPAIFRHGKDLYLAARRDLGGPFDQGLDALPFAERKAKYLAAYSLRPKRTALYRIDRGARAIVHLCDLPSAGDNAFPAVRRTGEHSFLVANYTSPLEMTGASWLDGQVSPRGTQIYLLALRFVPRR
jgi:hypothetical protein